MIADKLAEALRNALNHIHPRDSELEKAAVREGLKALADHESDRALAALTAEQKSLGMYEDEKQEPVAYIQEDSFHAMKGAKPHLSPYWRIKIVAEWDSKEGLIPLYASPQQEPDRLAKLPLPVQDACDIDYCSGSEMGYAEGWNDAIDAAKEAKP